MTRAEILALADECERAEQGSRELSARVQLALGHFPQDAPDWLIGWGGDFIADKGRIYAVHSDGRRGIHWEPPHITASVDACLEAVPEGWTSRHIEEDIAQTSISKGMKWFVRLRPPDSWYEQGNDVPRTSCFGHTLPLAFSAALLRARAAEMDD